MCSFFSYGFSLEARASNVFGSRTIEVGDGAHGELVSTSKTESRKL